MTGTNQSETGAVEPGTSGRTSLPADAHIGRVRLRVADLERSLGFYRDVLGFSVTRDEGRVITLSPGGESESVGDDAAPVSQALIVLEETPGIASRPRRPVTTGLYHVALLVPTRRALGRALIGLGVSRYPLRGMSDHAVSESLYLDDPDGNGLEIYADRPRAEWPRVDGGIVMTVDPMDVKAVLGAADERPGPWTGLPRETVVGHVHFTVSGLERSLEFYRDVIGFDVTMRIPTLVAVSAGGYHHHVNLNTWAGEGAPRDSEQMAGIASWELVIADGDAHGMAVARVEGARARSGGRADAVAARDPDGIAVHLVRTAST